MTKELFDAKINKNAYTPTKVQATFYFADIFAKANLIYEMQHV